MSGSKGGDAALFGPGTLLLPDGSPAPGGYNPYKDKQYIEQKKFLDTLKTDIERNNKRMTPEEIIAALNPNQQSIINQQSNRPTYTGTWGSMNNSILPSYFNQSNIVPIPQNIGTIQQLLSNSNFVPNANTTNTGNIGVK